MSFDSNAKESDLGTDAGCTSNVVYFNADKIYCANAGDSRAVL